MRPVSGVWLDRKRRVALLAGAAIKFAQNKTFRREFYISLAKLVREAEDPEKKPKQERRNERLLSSEIIEQALRLKIDRPRVGVNLFMSADSFSVFHPQFIAAAGLIELLNDLDIEIGIILCGDRGQANEYDARILLQNAGLIGNAQQSLIQICGSDEYIRFNINDLNVSLDNFSRKILVSTLIYHDIFTEYWNFEFLGNSRSRFLVSQADVQFEMLGGSVRQIIEQGQVPAEPDSDRLIYFRHLRVPRPVHAGPAEQRAPRLLILVDGELSDKVFSVVAEAVDRFRDHQAPARGVAVRCLSTGPGDGRGNRRDWRWDAVSAFDVQSLSDTASWASAGLVVSSGLEVAFAARELSALGLPTVCVAVDSRGVSDLAILASLTICKPTAEAIAASVAEVMSQIDDPPGRPAIADQLPLGFDLAPLRGALCERLRSADASLAPQSVPAGSTFAVSTYGVRYRLLRAASEPYGQSVCIFIHFDRNNIVDDYVRYYVDALNRAGYDILFVSSSDLSIEEISKISTFCRELIIRDNIGLDFSGWALALEHLGDLGSIQELLMVNDSVYGPLGSLDGLLDRMRDSEGDVVGLVESFEISPHVQSWFLMFKKPALENPVFAKFWGSVLPLTRKDEIITRYEVAMADRFREEGVQVTAIASLASADAVPTNPTHADWRTLLTMGIPFIKVQLLRDNPVDIDIRRWDQTVRKMGHDPGPIINHLARVGGTVGLAALGSGQRRAGTDRISGDS